MRRQQYYRSFCFQGAKSLLKQLHERYGKQLLKNACVAFLSTVENNGLTDIDDILQLLNVNEETPNGHSPFENLLLWARHSRCHDTEQFNKLEQYLVRNGAGNVHDAIHHGCLQRVKELVVAGVDLSCILQQTMPWDNAENMWQPLLHAIYVGEVEIVQYLLEHTNVDASSCRWNDGALVSTLTAAKGNDEMLSVLLKHGAVNL